MQKAVSTFIYVTERLHPGLLDGLARSGAEAIEIFAARQHLMRAGTPLGELPHDNALKDVLARFEPEDRIAKFDLAGVIGVEVQDLCLHGVPSVAD